MHLILRTAARQGLTLLCVGLAGYGAARLLTHDQRAYAQANAKPFTLKLDFYSYSKEPAGELYAREITARKSDGTTVTARTVGPVEKNIWARFITVPGGERVEADDALGLKTTFPLSTMAASLLERLTSPQQHCVSGDSVFLRDDTVLGHPASVVQRERGSDRMTWWFAYDLGCETLGYTYEEKAADGAWKTGIAEKASDLVLGEPEADRFTLSPSLTEAKPSETTHRYYQLLGIKRSPAERESGDLLDRDYERQQKPPQP